MDPGLISVAVAVGINAIYAIRKGHNVFIILLGGGVLMFLVSALNAIPGSSMGTAVGATFLIGTIVYRGQDILSFLTSLLGAK